MISVQRKKEKVNKYKGLAKALKNLKEGFLAILENYNYFKK